MAGNENSGRTLKFRTIAELRRRIDAYFLQREKDGKKPSLTSLNEFLGVWHGYLTELASEKPIFADVIKQTIGRIATFYEDGTNDGSTKPALGIFMLKNCGYTDRVEVNAMISDNSSLGDLAKAVRDKRAKQGKH